MPDSVQLDDETLLIAVQHSLQQQEPDLWRELFESPKEVKPAGLNPKLRGLPAVLAHKRQELARASAVYFSVPNFAERE
jgi:hypothetical protein